MKKFTTFLVAGVLAATLAAPAGAKNLRYGTQDEPQTLDPHSANLGVTNRLLSSVYEGLVMRDKNFKIVPCLALWWSQPDQRTWRFKLRPNVKFHDGSPLTADDVVFSVDRALSTNSQLKSSLQGVMNARKIDDMTVDLIMKEPNPVLINHLLTFRIMSKIWAQKNNAMLPQDYKKQEDTYAARNANGTGPFMVKERQPDVKTVLVAFPDWWNKSAADKGNLDGVTLLPVKSKATRLAGLLSGELDFVNDTALSDFSLLKAKPEIKTIEGVEGRVQYIAFDQFSEQLQYSNIKGKNPFKDLRVRQAIAHAIDEEAIKSKVMRGFANPTGSIITSTEQGYSKEADRRLPYDIAKAKALLADAGYPNGFEVTFDCGDNAPAPDICQAIPPMLAQIGIKVRPNIMPGSNFFPKLQKFDTSMYLLSWGTPTFDALYTLLGLLHSHATDNSGNGDSNYGRYSNPKVDKLIQQIKTEFDMKKRDAYIREVLIIARDDLPVLPLHQPIAPWAMRKGVTAQFAPNNVPYFYRFSAN
jgi:peptide/nickel transport system substrate-binding protein